MGFGAYVGSTNTKSLVVAVSGFWLAGVTFDATIFGMTEPVSADGGRFAVISFFGSGFTTMTRDPNGDMPVFAVTEEVWATLLGTLALAAVSGPVYRVNTRVPPAAGVSS